MSKEQITVEARVKAPIERVWEAYTQPEHVRHWNFASDDWHCPMARADLREGGTFSARMEAKDGSFGFDFEGTYTKLIPHRRIEYAFGERHAFVEFLPEADLVTVRVSFEPEDKFSRDQQRDGWQAILNNFARHAAEG